MITVDLWLLVFVGTCVAAALQAGHCASPPTSSSGCNCNRIFCSDHPSPLSHRLQCLCIFNSLPTGHFASLFSSHSLTLAPCSHEPAPPAHFQHRFLAPIFPPTILITRMLRPPCRRLLSRRTEKDSCRSPWHSRNSLSTNNVFSSMESTCRPRKATLPIQHRFSS